MIKRIRRLFLLLIMVSTAVSRADPVLEDTIDQRHVIDPTATFSIRNTDGSIMLYGTNTNELRIQAIKKAYNAERLNQIAIDVSIHGNEVSIDTKYPPKPKSLFGDRSGTVDYVIVVPQTCRIATLELINGEVLVDGMRGQPVHASLVNGRMYVRNCYAETHLSVTSGGLDVGYDWWETRPFSLHAKIVNGNMRACIPSDGGFHLRAEALNGQIANEFPGHRTNGLTKKIDTVIGERPDAEIQIQAGNGNIHLVEVNL